MFSPPRLRLPEQEDGRRATWLELFYDLVFVVAVGTIGGRLFKHTSPLGLLQALILFLPLWWAWVGHTIYDTRFDTDDLFQRLCTFGIMLAASAMAFTIPYAFEGRAELFALSYILSRLFLFGMYLRAYKHVSEARPIIRLYLIGFGIGDFLWLISLFLPTPWCYVLWMIGMLINLITPWLGIHTLAQAPINDSHVPERFSSFAIILLGEIISVTITRTISPNLNLTSFLAFTLSFCICACIWWIYFSFLDIGPVKQNLGPGQPYIYIHLPLLFGLLILSAGLEHAVSQANSATFSPATLWLLGIGMLLWLLSGFLLKVIMLNKLDQQKLSLRIITAAGITLTCILGIYLPPLLILILLFGILLFFVSFESHILLKRTKKPHDSPEILPSNLANSPKQAPNASPQDASPAPLAPTSANEPLPNAPPLDADPR